MRPDGIASQGARPTPKYERAERFVFLSQNLFANNVSKSLDGNVSDREY